MAARPERPGVRLPGGEGRAGAHRDAEDVRSAARRAGRAAAVGRGAARQAAALPDRRRRARAARAPDDGGAAEDAEDRRDRTEDAGVRARLRRRLEARPHREREEEARRRVAPDARGGGGGARASRPGGARPRRDCAGRDPAPRVAPAASAAPRPARDRRDRPRVDERDPPHGEALAVRAVHRPLRRRGRAARHGDERGAGAGPRAARARCGQRAHLPRPQQARAAVPRLRHTDRADRLRGAHDLLLPRMPDRRPRPQGPGVHVRGCSARAPLYPRARWRRSQT